MSAQAGETAEMLVQRALVHHRAGQLVEAQALYAQALAMQPSHHDALHYLGVCLHDRGDYAAAWDCLRAAMTLRPDAPPVYVSAGNTLREMGKLAEAIACYRRAASLGPRLAIAHFNLGTALEEAGDYDRALAAFESALAVQPSAAALVGKANCLSQLARLEEAVASYRLALQAEPGDADARTNLAMALASLGRHDEALVLAEQVLTSPAAPDARGLFNRGQLHFQLGRMASARACFERAWQLRPDLPWLAFQMSALDLLEGRFESGWRGHERRREVPDHRAQRRTFAQPLWSGEDDVKGKILLVHAEQGLGDTLQFCRYLPLVAERGARVIAQVQAPLLALLRRSLAPDIALVPEGAPLPRFDLQSPLLSLPLACGTNANNIPARTPYLVVDEARRSGWRSRLPGPARLRVGLAWSGNPAHNNDRNRSLPLASLQPLLALASVEGLPCVEFLALQPQLRPADADVLANHPQLRFPGAQILDFDDTAALASLCDLVISVDTAAAHLAGALARPVWVLLPHVPDWRWMLARPDSPWYPQARLFRQARPGDWTGVLDGVARALRAWIDAARPDATGS